MLTPGTDHIPPPSQIYTIPISDDFPSPLLDPQVFADSFSIYLIGIRSSIDNNYFNIRVSIIYLRYVDS